MKIYKYRLKPLSVTPITLPSEAEPLSVICQGTDVQLYVRVDTPNEMGMHERYFALYSTGDLVKIDEGYTSLGGNRGFIGTVQKDPFIWHCFEVYGSHD